MSERINLDGGSILDLVPVISAPVAGPRSGQISFYYLDGEGFRYEIFGDSTVYELGGAGGLTHWSEDVDGNLTPNDSSAQNLGDADALINEISARSLLLSAADGGYPYMSLQSGALSLTDQDGNYPTQYGRGDDGVEGFPVLGGYSLRKGAASPDGGGGVSADIPALYIKTDGSLWTKTGATDTDWTVLAAGGSDANAFHKGGDAFGEEAFIGTLDAFSFTLCANDNERIELKSAGSVWNYCADPGLRGITNDSQLDPVNTGPGFVEGWVADYDGETRLMVSNKNAGAACISSFNATNDVPGDGGLSSHYTEFGLPGTGFADNLNGIHPDEAFWEQSNCGLHMVNSNDFPMHFSINTRGAPGAGYPKRVLQLTSTKQIFRGPLITGSVNTDDSPVSDEAFLSIGDIIVKEDVNAELMVLVHNPHNGTGAFASFRAENNSTAAMVMGITANSFTPSGGLEAEEGFLASTEGMNLVTDNTGDIKFSPDGTLRAYFGGTNGEFLPASDGVGSIGTSGIRWEDIYGANAHFSTLLEVKNSVAGDLNLYAWNTSANAAAKAYVRAINDQGADISMVMTSSGGTHEGTLLYEAGAGATTGIVIDASAGYIKFKSGSALRGYFNSGAGEFLPGGGDGTGSIGASGVAWNDIYIKNAAHVGDLVMSDSAMGTKWTLREAKIPGEDKRALYAIDEITGKKYKLMLAPV